MRTIFLATFCWLIASVGLSLWSQEEKAPERTRVCFETSKGDFTVELYNETPKHRANFLRLIDEKAYDNVIFHRVINNFVVQGGNLKTKTWEKQSLLPEDETEGTLEAEIMPELFIHEKGALAAARQPDEVNPERKSSASQFYIVTGKYYTDFDLDEMEQKKGIHYSPEQRERYMFKGGTPELDGEYTVFGRLIDGWKTIDKIQHLETDEVDNPRKTVRIERAYIVEPKR